MQLAVVVPVKGRPDLLQLCLSSILEAAEKYRNVELIFVDNNPGEDVEPVLSRVGERITVVKSHARTVGAVRNEGVKRIGIDATVVVFVDSDCIVPMNFLEMVASVFTKHEAIHVAGCKVKSPFDGHWTEVSSDELHREAGDGPRRHLNSGCMAVRVDAFSAVGGFTETLPANEDYDLCEKVAANGGSIWQFEALSVTHLGNPKSIGGFFRRLRWHGKGAFDANGRLVLSTMSIGVLLNSMFLLLGFMGMVALATDSLYLLSLVCLIGSLTVVPLLGWLGRMRQHRRWIRPHLAIPLLQITFIARQFGMLDRYLELTRRNN
ncbi:glycosyltransferase family 2 protein [Gemmatimonas sp.]